MIVPKSISYVDKWRSIRDKLMENGFKEIADVSDAFVGVNLEQVVILGERNLGITNLYNSSVFREQNFQKINSFDKHLSNKWSYWFIYSSFDEIKIFQKILDESKLFKNVFIDSFEGLSGIRKYFLPISKGEVPILIGKDIDKYYFHKPSYAIKRNIIFNLKGVPKTRKIELLLRPNKIIGQNVLTKAIKPAERVLIKTTIDEDGIFVFNTVQVIFLPDDCPYSQKFLLAVLNSVLISWFATYFIYNKAKLTMHFDKEYAGKIPIYPATPDQQAPIISLVDAIIQKKKEYHAISQNIEDYIKFKDVGFIKLDEYIKKVTDGFDVLSSIKVKNDNFDILRVKTEGDKIILEYGIRKKVEEYEEVEEEEQTEVRGRYITEWYEAGIGSIKDREAIEFLTKVLEGIKNFSKSKQKSIWQKIAEVKIPEFNEYVKNGFLKYKSAIERVKELDEEITKIDRAIDRFVYDLYGLTEEEIQVVEKSVWGEQFEEMYSKLPSKEAAIKLSESVK